MTSAPAAPPVSQELLETALDIARGAGEVAMQWFRTSKLSVEFKGDGSPVTQGDKAAERYIRERIEAYAPDSSLVGEEEGSSQGSSGLTWYIDPIDGTKGFARGVPLFATLLAVEDEHGLGVGVINIPATGEVVWAGRGLGAFCNDGPAHVSERTEVKGAFVTTSSVSRWGTHVFDAVNNAGADIRGWGDGYGWLMAATGRIDAMIELNHGTPWDFGPVPVIMEEAGGVCSDIEGVTTIHGKSLVAANAQLQQALLPLLRD